MDLERNRKPKGYNCPGEARLIFPITDNSGIEFYMYSLSKGTKIVKTAKRVSQLLTANGFLHEVKQDEMVGDTYRRKKSS